jgi:hypothetical protein
MPEYVLDEILAMPPGPELDIVISDIVFDECLCQLIPEENHKHYTTYRCIKCNQRFDGKPPMTVEINDKIILSAPYSINKFSAQGVQEKMFELGYTDYSLKRKMVNNEETWQVSFISYYDDTKSGFGKGKTIPEAISKAAITTILTNRSN